MVEEQYPDWAISSVNLADTRIGAEAIECSDDFFAPMARMLKAEAAVFIAGKYDDNGKWMDGWESRRKRTRGHDWCVVRLGRPGRIRGFDIDTSHFTGNFPQAASVDGCQAGLDPDLDHSWRPLLPPSSLSADSHHFLASAATDTVWSHLRLNIFPDGGVARLRVYGLPVAEKVETNADGLVDLGAIINGGHAIAWNDSHYGHPNNLLLPGRGVDMGDGWETRRRREPGNDWCLLALGLPGSVVAIEIDTAHFKGNFPDRCSLLGAYAPDVPRDALIAQSQFWQTLLPEQSMRADSIHAFSVDGAGPGLISHVLVNMHPDGGLSRLRLWGRPD